MDWYEFCFSSKCDYSEVMSAFFIGEGIDELVIEDPFELINLNKSDLHWDYADESIINPENKTYIYKAYAELSEVGAEELYKRFQAFALDNDLETELVHVETIDPQKGQDEWKKFFKPFELIKGFRVCPSWEICVPKAGELIVHLDPGGAFGTGTHETTRMCAELLEYCFDRKKPKGEDSVEVLDIGTGSGILSILALKMGAKHALGVDIDEFALETARENAEKNGVSSRFSTQDALSDYGSGFDIILANLIAPIIIDLYPRIEAACKTGSKVILSGILKSAREDVEKVFSADSWTFVKSLEDGDWTALYYLKK